MAKLSWITLASTVLWLTMLFALTALFSLNFASAAIATVGATFLISIAAYLRRPLTHYFVAALLVLLLGYSVLGRGFAYLGVPPVYVGELVLALGIVAIAAAAPTSRAFRGPIITLLALFMAWGAIRTLPFLSQHGVDALRDGVAWAYATFALHIVAFIRSWYQLSRLLAWYARAVPLWLVWFPVYGVLHLLARDTFPTVPGTNVALFGLKFGDVGVHLAGAGAFLALGLAQRLSNDTRLGRFFVRFATPLWALWIVGFLIASSNRGALVSMLLALAVVVVLRPMNSSWLRIAAVALLLSPLAFVVSLRPDTPPLAAGVLQRVESVAAIAFGREDEAFRAGTARWRLNWWSDILGYTVFGEYRWTGKGYGINLANVDGYQVFSDESLRSPHNGHLTILARSGVPGAVLWLLLQGWFGVSLVVMQQRLRRQGFAVRANVGVWILAYWTAFMSNMSFDVFLEGPQGGIWFWVVFGLGLVWMRCAPFAQNGPR